VIDFHPPGAPEFDAGRLIYACANKALDAKGTAIIDAPKNKGIDEMTLADYVPLVAKVWDSFRLLP
jgi:hypothetical protein